MRVIVERSDRTSGSRRLYRALVDLGCAVSRRRVERLMRQAQWRARVVRMYRRTTGTHRWFAQHPNRVRAQMTTAPDQIGSATSRTCRWRAAGGTSPPFWTGTRAACSRGGGCALLVAHGALQSMTRSGAPDENAHMESFCHSLKAELLHGRTFTTARALRTALARCARYYNQERLHSSLGEQSPVDDECRAA